jgi:chromosome transmission fidelity protein 1
VHLVLAGTGKTLSLICSSLQWLQDQRQREAAEAALAAASLRAGGAGVVEEREEEVEEDAPDWMRGFAEQEERQRQQQLLDHQRRRVAKAKTELLGSSCGRAKKAAAAAGRQRGGQLSDAVAVQGAGGAGDVEDAEFLVADWQSDDGEENGSGGAGTRKRSSGIAGLRSGASSSSEGDSDAESLLGEGEEVELPRKRQVGGFTGGGERALPAAFSILPPHVVNLRG